MSLPYSTATAGQNALREIEKILMGFGCQNFGTMFDNEKGALIVVFKYRDRQVSMEASWKGYAGAYLRENPYKEKWSRVTRAEFERQALAQAKISVCSVIRDRIKGEVTAVECGIASFESVFLADLLLPSGERVMERISSEKFLPAPAEQKVVEMKR